MLTAERLKEVLHYEPATGVFTRRKGGNGCVAGSIAGAINSEGYRIIRIDNRIYKAHRLAWLYVHGVWPESQIDHVDRDRANNRFCNLRPVTNSQNMQNKVAQKNNTTGYPGVTLDRRSGRWQARICLARRRSLGYFDSAEEAHAAYVAAAEQLHSHRPQSTGEQHANQ